MYKNPSAFTDIVNGKSRGCNGTVWGNPIIGNFAIVPDAGWDAVEGWVSAISVNISEGIVTDALLQDPVTGLGTPKFDMLLKI